MGDVGCFWGALLVSSWGLRILSTVWPLCVDGVALSRVWVIAGGASLDAWAGAGGGWVERATGVGAWGGGWVWGDAMAWLEE